ncbi:transporter substrate-binding domain-containing protein [Zooshikella harenae]|uniref:Uncharacterized protein n=1 Tax=Zooshikella harenae TaxID=2827238 RepID=A0ABS5ZHF7_9GAMM|nr:transporter substrate-binding domain-containing protein [Zooshikella harenae]MBU2713414.1 hypothetical protein [Zooshikella harenae]
MNLLLPLSLVIAVFELINIPVEVQYHPWKRCEKLVENGDYFGALPYFKNKDRENRFIFSTPIVNSVNTFFYSVERFPEGFTWSSLNSFKKYTIAAVNGYWYVSQRLGGL